MGTRSPGTREGTDGNPSPSPSCLPGPGQCLGAARVGCRVASPESRPGPSPQQTLQPGTGNRLRGGARGGQQGAGERGPGGCEHLSWQGPGDKARDRDGPVLSGYSSHVGQCRGWGQKAVPPREFVLLCRCHPGVPSSPVPVQVPPGSAGVPVPVSPLTPSVLSHTPGVMSQCPLQASDTEPGVTEAGTWPVAPS